MDRNHRGTERNRNLLQRVIPIWGQSPGVSYIMSMLSSTVAPGVRLYVWKAHNIYQAFDKVSHLALEE